MDLAALLIHAIEQQRDQLEQDAEPFIGRIPFHVNIDVNLAMKRIVPSVEPCRDPSDCEQAA